MERPDIARLVEVYGGQYDRLRRELDRRTGVIWDELGGVSDDELERWLATIIPLVTAAERNAFSLFSGFAASLAALGGLRRRPPASVIADRSGRGVPPRDVFSRPVITMRALLAQGRDYLEARDVARSRAIETANTNVVLAHRNAADQEMRNLGVTGYRRALTGDSCPLCRGAARRVYATGDLMPIHTNCDCRVVPIFGTADVGAELNDLVLRSSDSSSESGVEQHGELGPVLVNPSHTFSRLAGA